MTVSAIQNDSITKLQRGSDEGRDEVSLRRPIDRDSLYREKYILTQKYALRAHQPRLRETDRQTGEEAEGSNLQNVWLDTLGL